MKVKVTTATHTATFELIPGLKRWKVTSRSLRSVELILED